MAKRFTDTNKYKKPFIRGLQGPYKLLWDYLYHDCDHAGIWIVDFEVAQLYLGSDMVISKSKALESFNTDEVRILELNKGSKWFIVPFISFQYGELNPSNRAHQSVIKILDSLGIDLNKPLTRPLQGAMDMVKDKDKERSKKRPETITFPPELDTIEFHTAWQEWLDYRKEAKKKMTPRTIKMQLKNLAEYSVSTAIATIETSIKNGWQGLFPEKQNERKTISAKGQKPLDFSQQKSAHGVSFSNLAEG